MPQITVFFGIILIVAGFGGYFMSGMESWTALIPSFFGIIFLVLGLLAYRENIRKHMMHATTIFALIGIIGSIGGVRPFFSYLGGADIERPLAAGMQSLMAIMCIIYIVLAVRSFIQARRGN